MSYRIWDVMPTRDGIARLAEYLEDESSAEYGPGEALSMARNLATEKARHLAGLLWATRAESGKSLDKGHYVMHLPPWLFTGGGPVKYAFRADEFIIRKTWRVPERENWYSVFDPWEGREMLTMDLETAREWAASIIRQSDLPPRDKARAVYRAARATRACRVETRDGVLGFTRFWGFEIDRFLASVIFGRDYGTLDDLAFVEGEENVKEAREYLEWLESEFGPIDEYSVHVDDSTHVVEIRRAE